MRDLLQTVRTSFRRLPLRWRLTLWYALLVTLALAAFAGALYSAVSSSLHKNLDASLGRVASSLDFIIKQKQQESRLPLRRQLQRRRGIIPFEAQTIRSDSVRADTSTDEPDAVWMAIYEHLLFNARTFIIQIADTSGIILWRSAGNTDTLPTFRDLVQSEPLPQPYPLLKTAIVGQQHYRIAAVRTQLVEIVVGYPLTEIEQTLKELFGVLRIGLPLVFIVIVIGGYWLARSSLRQVDVITRTAQEITAHHLDRRLPLSSAGDEIARLTETLNDMIARLEQSFRQIQQFTSDASHELRTPLAILMGELELMLRRPHTVEEYQAALASALEEVGRLSKVVEGLLELSRAESGQVQLEWELFDLSELVASVTDDVAVLAEEHGIMLTATLQPYVRIVGDRTRLQQVVINVLDNAVKYTPHGGSVAIQLSIEDAAAVLTVRDTGIGIPPEDLPRIFDRFYRVDKARHRTAGGSGLGLSIVQWIIHAHHGSISVESAEGVGTTVTIRLPLDGRDGAVQLSEERVQPLRNQ